MNCISIFKKALDCFSIIPNSKKWKQLYISWAWKDDHGAEKSSLQNDMYIILFYFLKYLLGIRYFNIHLNTEIQVFIPCFPGFDNTHTQNGASQVVLAVKNTPANAGDLRDLGPIPGSGRSPGGGHGNPLQYSCLENPRDRGAWQATVHGVAKSHTTEAT